MVDAGTGWSDRSDPAAAARAAERPHELVIIGGGVQGLTAALLAAEAGVKPLLLEKGAVGDATSGAWFRILHGGLRYLQTLDVPRLRASVAERRWFLTRFPDQCRLMSFLMPLYGVGLKRPGAFRAAFLAEAMLSADRNRGVRASLHAPLGRVLSAEAVVERFPGVRREGLKGGALWTEAIAPDGPALIDAMSEAAQTAGATLLERAAVEAIDITAGAVSSVRARTADGVERVFRTDRVLNAAGPWAHALARRADPSTPTLFHPALGFNLLLDRPAPASCGVSVAPPGPDGAMLFIYPDGPRAFVGTWYAPWADGPEASGLDASRPPAAQIDAFLETLNAAVPDFGANRSDILEVTAGWLPATKTGTTDLRDRDVVHDHGAQSGPRGLVSLVGVKYTTARKISAKALAALGVAADP